MHAIFLYFARIFFAKNILLIAKNKQLFANC